MTTRQVEHRLKTETRRLGWWDTKADKPRVKPGERLLIAHKLMGLGAGGRPRPLAVVEVVETWREPLGDITPDAVVREGFPGRTPSWFVAMFINANRCRPNTPVTVIRWRYLELGDLTPKELAQWNKMLTRWDLRPGGAA